MAKKVAGYLKLQVPAGAANPSPPIGPALGQRGINIMEFCKAFNAQQPGDGEGLADPRRHHLLPGQVLHLPDEDAAGQLLPQEGGERCKKGSATAGRGIVGSVTREQVREIATQKMADLNAVDIEGAMKMVEGSARSMGLQVVD